MKIEKEFIFSELELKEGQNAIIVNGQVKLINLKLNIQKTLLGVRPVRRK